MNRPKPTRLDHQTRVMNEVIKRISKKEPQPKWSFCQHCRRFVSDENMKGHLQMRSSELDDGFFLDMTDEFFDWHADNFSLQTPSGRIWAACDQCKIKTFAYNVDFTTLDENCAVCKTCDKKNSLK